MTSSISRFCTVVSVLAALGSTTVLSQTHLGSIHGAVTDPTGAAVPGAPFRLIHQATNVARTGALARDWQLAGIVSLQSGRPFTVALQPPIDNSNTGFAGGSDDRPNLVGDPSVSDPSPDAWFNADVFATPPFGSFGNAGRNILDGPGFKNLNVALGPAARLQVRIEAFNLFNNVNFDLPDKFLESPTFGQVLSAGDARRVRLGLRLIF